MKTIEERAKETGILSQYRSDYPYDKRSVEFGYISGAKEQMRQRSRIPSSSPSMMLSKVGIAVKSLTTSRNLP